ncbi:MAG: hypothetical protein ACK47U_02120, partial [Verrucomicrobiota bacterium]
MAPRQPLPNISEDDLIDLAGGATVLLAKELIAKGKVKKALWTPPVAEALVDDGTESREARWNLRSVTFQRNECGCDVSVGRRKLCVHSVAAYLVLAAKEGYLKAETAPPAKPAAPPGKPPTTTVAKENTTDAKKEKSKQAETTPAGPRLKSLTLSEKRGTPIEVRFIVPPNIATAAVRDEIICRLELRVDGAQVAPENLDRSKAWTIEPDTVFFLAILENLCHGKLQGILPLTRRHLRQLLAIGKGLTIFRMANAPATPLTWDGDHLDKVHEHLDEPVATPQTNAAGEAPDDGPEEQEVRSQERGRDDRPWVDGSMKWLRIRLPQQSSGPVAELRDVLQRSGFTLETTTREWYLAGTIQ